MNTIKVFAAHQHADSPISGLAKLVFLGWTLLMFYCIFNGRVRNLVLGEFYKLRGMKNSGSPASVRTAVIAFILSSGVLVSFLFPRFWQQDYSGVLFVVLYATVMVSSYVDARDYRKGKLR